jgi:HK97 family phage prohead protease
MELKRKLYSGATETLTELRRVAVICSSPNPDVEREILVQAGIRLDRFRNIPVVLFNHNPDWPIARCIEIGVVDGMLRAVVEFPPEGASARSDEIYNLIKAGVITGVSIGFLPIETEPIDPKESWGPQRYLQCELLEFSFVSIPANSDAVVTDKSATAAEERSGESKAIVRLSQKGLYEVGWLASLLESLGYLESYVAFEAAVEEDGSQVPAMLHDALQRLGAALVAMTAEEVTELLAGDDDDEDAAPAAGDDIVMRARTDFLRLGLKLDPSAMVAWASMLREQAKGGSFVIATGPDVVKQAIAVCRAGKVLSGANQDLLNKAMEHHKSMAEHHKAMGECIKAVLDTAGNSAESEEADEGQGGVEGGDKSEKAAMRRRVAVLRFQNAA